MNVSTRWLRDLVPGLEAGPAEIAEHLALRGAPVEDVTSPGQGLDDIVVGRVVDAGPHPNADRLSLCEVDGGDGIVQVVCGAPNVRAGAFYPFAPVGAVLPGDFKIKKAKIRGEVSQGMLCSAKELGLGADHSGILEIHGDFTPGDSFVASLGLDDATLDVEITANRGDLLSHVGIARELASEGGGAVVLPPIPEAEELTVAYAQDSQEVEAGDVRIRIDAPELCPRYLGAVIRGVRVAPSPSWLQERLRGAGARPINNVVDATNYVMLELGQPMHAFDLGRLEGDAIVVRTPGPEELKFTTLDDEARSLSKDMLMICDAHRPVAIAGVMGGQNSEVDEETTDILLECALFDPKSIRSTRRALGMSTDASYRFERGVDPASMRSALERCVAIILATAGGRMDDFALDCYPVPFEPRTVQLRLARIERLLGIPFEASRVQELLEPLGFQVADPVDGILSVVVPGHRSYDVTREVDLIEEVARTHGYDAFPDTLGPARPGTVPDDRLFQLCDELRATLASRGLFEAHTPAFAPRGEGDVEVANPLAATEPVMRRAILPALLRRIEYNLARGNRDVRLFEIGTSFRKADPGAAPHEETHIAAVLTGRREPPHWSRADEPLEIWDLRGLLDDVVVMAHGVGAAVTPAGPDVADGLLDSEASFVVRDAAGAVIGHGGRVAPQRVDLPAWAGDVFALELTLPENPADRPAVTYRHLPQQPATERDLALLVPAGVTAADLFDRIRESAGPHLESLQLFDLYTGEGVVAGARSLAFRLRFRASDRTLKDQEVDRSVNAVLQRLQEELGVETRG